MVPFYRREFSRAPLRATARAEQPHPRAPASMLPLRNTVSLSKLLRRPSRSNQARQTRRTAPGGNKAERRFRQADLGRWIIRCHAVIARERDLIAAARARAVNRRDSRNLERGEAIKNVLAFGDECAHFASQQPDATGSEIGAGDEDRFFRGRHDQALERRFVLDGRQVLAQVLALLRRRKCSRRTRGDRTSAHKFRLQISRRIMGAVLSQSSAFILANFAKFQAELLHEQQCIAPGESECYENSAARRLASH